MGTGDGIECIIPLSSGETLTTPCHCSNQIRPCKAVSGIKANSLGWKVSSFGGRWQLSLRQQGRNIRIDSMRETFGADYPFAGIPRLERPEEGSALPGTFYLDSAYRDSKSSRFLVHYREAAFIGICAATKHDRLACLAMEDSVGLSATCQDQYHEEY
jgi:hypothetical protein